MTTKQKFSVNNKAHTNDAIAKLALVSALGAGLAWLANRYLDTVEADIARQNEALDAKQGKQVSKPSIPKNADSPQSDSDMTTASSLKDSVSGSLTEILNKTLNPQSKAGAVSLKPQQLKGKVVHAFEEFSFTTDGGASYHVYDPDDVLASIARDRGVFDTYYTLSRVHLTGLVSGVGNYGHMGRFERQLTVVSR